MSFEGVLDKYGVVIEEELRRYLSSIVKDGYRYHPFIGDLYNAVKEFTLRRGKRLASCSTLLAYEGYTNQIDEKILRVCCGIEIYRHCILVHDDLVDADTMRRRGKTLHKILEEEYDERFGACSAIFAGNILYPLALQAILSSGFEGEKLIKAANLLSSGYRDVNESQILDLLFEYTSPSVDEWKVMVSKRATSLFKVTILIGAVLGEAPKEDLPLLKEAGKRIGYAFDIQDDIIDTFASEEQYGRRPCGDLLRNKKPLHIILALKSSKRLASLLKRVREAGLDERGMEKIRKLIKDCGALDTAKNFSKKYAEEGRDLILKTKMNKKAKEFFTSFIDYIEKSLDWYK